MSKRLILFILLMSVLVITCPINAQNESPIKTKAEKNRLNQTKASSNTEKPMDNPYKDLEYGSNENESMDNSSEEGLFFLEDSTAIPASEYKKKNLLTDAIVTVTKPFVMPKNKEIWFLSQVETYNNDNNEEKIDERELALIQKEMSINATQNHNVIAIEKQLIVIINKENNDYLTINPNMGKDDEMSNEKECDYCIPQKFTIDTEKTSEDQFVVEVPYGDNYSGIMIRFSFKKIAQP